MNMNRLIKQLAVKGVIGPFAFCLLLAWTGLQLLSCSDKGLRPTENDMKGFVLQGYLYRGQPVADIRLVSLIPFGSEDSIVTTVELDEETGDTLNLYEDTIKVTYPINDAEVKLITGGKTYKLHATGDSGWYADTSFSVIVKEDGKYRIEIKYLGKKAWAETVVPPRPTGLKISDTVLYRTPRGGRRPGGGQEGGQQIEVPEDLVTSLLVQWKNPDSVPYYVVSQQEEIDTSSLPENISPERLARMMNNARPRGGFTNADSMLITSSGGRNQRRGQVGRLQAQRPGKYMIKVYRVNGDFREIYGSIEEAIAQQDDGSLQEPLTNVHNGLGIFAAFNYDSVSFRMEQYQAPE